MYLYTYMWCKSLLVTDTTLVDEAFAFLEKNRVAIRPEKDDFSDSVAEFMQRNKLKINLQAGEDTRLGFLIFLFRLKGLSRENLVGLLVFSF